MKILLINPSVDIDQKYVKDIFTIESEIPPLGLLYIASSLEQQGHGVKIIDFGMEKYSDEKISSEIKNMDAIGITVRTHGLNAVIKITNQIKKQNPDLPIIIGGPHCTINPRQSLDDINADISVEGEGEEAIKLITKALQGKVKLENIPGIYYRKNNQIKKGLPQKIIENLDEIPFPARHLVNHYRYGEIQGGLNLTRGKVTSMMISRGCPYGCKFCTNKTITKKFRTRSLKNVIKEINQIRDKYEFLHIIDDNFFVDKKLAEDIFDYLIEINSNLELWISGIRSDAINKKYFKKMKKAGVKTINIGIESGNQKVLEYYNKQITLDDILRSTKYARSSGLLTIGYFIIGAPNETIEDIKKTIEFAKSIPIDMAIFSPLTYIKGSPIWDEAVREGKIKANELIVITDGARGLGKLLEEEIWQWCIKAFQDYYLRPRYILDQIALSFIRKDFRLIKEGYKLLLQKNNVLRVNKKNQANLIKKSVKI